MNTLHTSFTIMLSVVLLGQAADAQSPATTTLDVAVEQGLVSVEVTSLGGAVGNTVRVSVQRKVPQELCISLAPGTVFVSSSASVQNLVGSVIQGEFTGPKTYRPQAEIVLNDNRKHSYLIETYCIDFHKRAPRGGHVFTIGKPDARAMRILVGTKPEGSSIWAFQSALWMDRSGVSAEVLKKNFRVKEIDLKAAAALVEQATQAGIAAIPPNVSADVRLQLEGILSADPAAREKAAKALEGLGDQVAGLRAMWQANLPPAPPAQSVGDIVNTVESLSPANLQDLIPDADAILEQTDNLVNQILEMVPDAPGAPPLPKLQLRGQTRVGLRAMLPLLQSPRPNVRAAAARGLSAVRDPQAVEALIGALKDSDPRVQAAAAASLKQLTEQEFGNDPEAWQKWWDTAKQDFAATPETSADQTPAEKPSAEKPESPDETRPSGKTLPPPPVPNP